MKTSKILAAAALAWVAAAGAQAQTDNSNSVQARTGQRDRAEVRAQAVIASHSPNPYHEGASSASSPVLVSSGDRSAAASGALVAARSNNYEGFTSVAAPTLVTSIDRAIVKVQAVAAAHARNQNLSRYAFYNSEIPKEYSKPRMTFTR